MTQPIGRLLTMKELTRQLSLHRATIYRRIESGDFPKPMRLGRRASRWAERDVEAWKAAQLDSP